MVTENLGRQGLDWLARLRVELDWQDEAEVETSHPEDHVSAASPAYPHLAFLACLTPARRDDHAGPLGAAAKPFPGWPPEEVVAVSHVTQFGR